MENALLAQHFIEEIWNNQAFGKIETYLHPDFTDHSLPPGLPTNREGTKKWILGMGASFEHVTTIESQVSESDESILKIRMNLKHIGVWREIEPTGMVLQTAGFRHFKFRDGKILAHWAIIDGQALENQLKDAAHGCKIAK